MEKYQQVVYIQVFENKAKDLIPKLTKELTDMDIRPYFQIVPCDGVMISASSIDEWVTKFIEIMHDKNIMVSIQSGKPGCPNPNGCA